jgi:hypothetical protein
VAIPQAPLAKPPPRTGVSWVGLAGAALGFGPMAALGVEILVDPPEIGRAFAAVPLLMAALYAPAAWASLARTERRRAILRGSLVASLVLAFTGSVLLGPVLLLVLAPATALIWLASGGMRWGR